MSMSLFRGSCGVYICGWVSAPTDSLTFCRRHLHPHKSRKYSLQEGTTIDSSEAAEEREGGDEELSDAERAELLAHRSGDPRPPRRLLAQPRVSGRTALSARLGTRHAAHLPLVALRRVRPYAWLARTATRSCRVSSRTTRCATTAHTR